MNKAPVIGDAYDRYMARIRKAQNAGYSNFAIIQELQHERATLQPRAMMKAATLAQDRNIYKKREAMRAANECSTAIDRICKELEPKEINA